MNFITFYNEPSSLVRSIPKHNVLIVGGDMIAPISKDENKKKICLHNSSKRNREHLTELSLKNGLTYLNKKNTEKEEETMDLHLRK